MACQRRKVDLNSLPDAHGGLTGSVLADHGLGGRGQSGERRQCDQDGDDPTERAELRRPESDTSTKTAMAPKASEPLW